MDLTSAIEVAQEIEDNSYDQVVDTNDIDIHIAGVDDTHRLYYSTPRNGSTGSTCWPMSATAERQTAQSCGIPFRYWEQSLASDPEFLRGQIQHWFRTAPKSRLLRIVAPVTQKASDKFDSPYIRAFVSDKYQPFRNSQLLQQLADSDEASECFSTEHLWQAYVDEERLAFGCNHPKLTASIEGSRLDGGSEVNDIVKGGLRLLNSEVGDGMLSLGFSIFRLVCKNGMVAPGDFWGYRRRHVGSTHAPGAIADFENPSDVVAHLQKSLQALTSDALFDSLVAQISGSTKIQVREDWVARLAKRFASISKAERDSIAQNFERDHDTSLWGATNAITYAAHDASQLRAQQLQSIGGEVLARPRNLVAH